MLFFQFNCRVLIVYRAEWRDVCSPVLTISTGWCGGDPSILQQLSKGPVSRYPECWEGYFSSDPGLKCSVWKLPGNPASECFWILLPLPDHSPPLRSSYKLGWGWAWNFPPMPSTLSALRGKENRAIARDLEKACVLFLGDGEPNPVVCSMG